VHSGGQPRFVVGFVAEVLSGIRRAGEAGAVGRSWLQRTARKETSPGESAL